MKFVEQLLIQHEKAKGTFETTFLVLYAPLVKA